MKRVLLAVLRGYRSFLSPLKRRPSCRFLPTCSEYAVDAVAQHGAVRGGGRALWRVLRCNPLFRGGYDPVDGTTPLTGEDG
jgi:putative membrane protein insertion efficiency factor